jgi:hypothetical protein
MAEWKRLGAEHVERRARKNAVLERIEQGSFVHQLSP